MNDAVAENICHSPDIILLPSVDVPFFQQCCRRRRCTMLIVTEDSKPSVLLDVKADAGTGVLPVKDGTSVYTKIRAIQNVNESSHYR